MSKKEQLRTTRAGTVINTTSKGQEVDVGEALKKSLESLEEKHPYLFMHSQSILLKTIVDNLRKDFPEEYFHHHLNTSGMKPDGGILYMKDAQDDLYPILISEVKNQGTNDRRKNEGLSRQSKGNAIERLGKNVIGFRTYMLKESINPFVCFGYGCDFGENSSILDRISTIAMFGEINKTHLYGTTGGLFKRGSFYFREEAWTVEEMNIIMFDIANRSVLYYISKYGEDYFTKRS